MTYSKIHKRFSKRHNKPEALTNPEKYLGPNYQDVLNFWIYLDTLSKQDKEKINDRYLALDNIVRDSAFVVARYAAKEVVGEEFIFEAWRAAYDVTRERVVFGDATLELIGDVKNKLYYQLIMSHKTF
jgi:hypothetical protein